MVFDNITRFIVRSNTPSSSLQLDVPTTVSLYITDLTGNATITSSMYKVTKQSGRDETLLIDYTSFTITDKIAIFDVLVTSPAIVGDNVSILLKIITDSGLEVFLNVGNWKVIA